MTKKSICFLWVVCLTVCLCACSPASKNSTLQYANSTYGNAKYVKTEKIDQDAIRYYFSDKEYGFEYYVTSYVIDIVFDGSKFGEAESKASNFDEAYYEYVLSQVEEDMLSLEEEHDVVILDGFDKKAQLGYEYQLAEIYFDVNEINKISKITTNVGDLFESYDTREYWDNMYITAYDEDLNKLGVYDFKYKKWMTPQEETDTFYYERIWDLNKEAVLLDKEQKLFKNTGIGFDNLAYVLGHDPVEESTVVTFYYFSVNGKEFFLADVLVMDENRNNPVWYTNYKE